MPKHKSNPALVGAIRITVGTALAILIGGKLSGWPISWLWAFSPIWLYGLVLAALALVALFCALMVRLLETPEEKARREAVEAIDRLLGRIR